MSAKVHLRRYRDANGRPNALAVIDLPTHVGAIRVTGVGSWFSDALSSAAHIATTIVNNPIAKAIMPPQVSLAINGIQTIANAAQHGLPALNNVLDSFSGPGKTRLVNALQREAPMRRSAPPPLVRPRPRPTPPPPPPPADDDDQGDDYDDDDDGSDYDDQGDQGGNIVTRDHR